MKYGFNAAFQEQGYFSWRFSEKHAGMKTTTLACDVSTVTTGLSASSFKIESMRYGTGICEENHFHFSPHAAVCE